MPVPPSSPAPGSPEFPQAGEPRHDAVPPNSPEFPHEVPRPVPPPTLGRRGSGGTHGDTADDNHPSLPSEAHARERSADMNTIPTGLPDWLAPHAEEVASWGPAPTAPTCWVAGCRRDTHLHGLCKTHHLRATRTWNPRPSHRNRKRTTDGSAS